MSTCSVCGKKIIGGILKGTQSYCNLACLRKIKIRSKLSEEQCIQCWRVHRLLLASNEGIEMRCGICKRLWVVKDGTIRDITIFKRE